LKLTSRYFAMTASAARSGMVHPRTAGRLPPPARP
jgi:hypothetical protein